MNNRQAINNRNDVIEIDLADIFGLLMSKLWLLILVTIIAGGIGYGISNFVLLPKYTSTTSIYILNKESGNNITYSDTQLATQLTKDYEALIIGRAVLEEVIRNNDLNMSYEQLRGKININNASGTRIIDISVTDYNARVAQVLADAIREVAAKHIREVTAVEAVNVANVANLPERPSSPSIRKWTMGGAALGFLLCAALLILQHLMDDSIKVEDDIQKYLELSVLAAIPDADNEKDSKKSKKSRRSKSEPASGEKEKKEEHHHEMPAEKTAEKPLSEQASKEELEIVSLEEKE